MKAVVLLYDTSCIYEIVILNYFLKVTGKEMQFVSLDGKEVTATEGYRIVPEHFSSTSSHSCLCAQMYSMICRSFASA